MTQNERTKHAQQEALSVLLHLAQKTISIARRCCAWHGLRVQSAHEALRGALVIIGGVYGLFVLPLIGLVVRAVLQLVIDIGK